MIRIKTDGVANTLRILENVAETLGDHREFFREDAVPLIQRETQRIFRTRGYGQWSPLSRATIRQKGHSRPLIRTRRYFREATQSPTLTITRTHMVYGVSVPYADYQEEGTARIPARPVFGLLARNMRFQRRLATRLDRRIQRAGR